jgi:hypothetical protein
MTVQELLDELDLTLYTTGADQRAITGGYASDLLSCVMAKAKPGNVWITLHVHPNIVAVASVLDLAAVIIAEGMKPEFETITQARKSDVILLGSPHTTYALVGRMSALGIPAGE